MESLLFPISILKEIKQKASCPFSCLKKILLPCSPCLREAKGHERLSRGRLPESLWHGGQRKTLKTSAVLHGKAFPDREVFPWLHGKSFASGRLPMQLAPCPPAKDFGMELEVLKKYKQGSALIMLRIFLKLKTSALKKYKVFF
jgi:hypothetical protein